MVTFEINIVGSEVRFGEDLTVGAATQLKLVSFISVSSMRQARQDGCSGACEEVSTRVLALNASYHLVCF
jgi:hypothetical protein